MVLSYDENLSHYIFKRNRNDGHSLHFFDVATNKHYSFYNQAKTHMLVEDSLIRFYNAKTNLTLDVI